MSRLDALPARDLPGGLTLREATGLRARALGLMGLRALPSGTALHIPRCRSVHTFWMRFELDLVWLGADGRVLRVDTRVPRRRNRACRGAASVVEAAAGEGAGFAAALSGGGRTAG